MDPTENTSSTVFFGAYVRLEDDNGDTVVYRIVGPDESDHNVGAISMDSPVGKSLMGKDEGDTVKVKRPKGTASFEIVDVSYTPLEA